MMWNEETVWQNNLRKITLVVEEDSEKDFKQSLVLEQLWDKKVDMAKQFAQWDKIKVTLDCRWKEYNGRRYNSISAWRMEKASGSTSANNQSDDLPF